jgi:hypothetical protein
MRSCRPQDPIAAFLARNTAAATDVHGGLPFIGEKRGFPIHQKCKYAGGFFPFVLLAEAAATDSHSRRYRMSA